MPISVLCFIDLFLSYFGFYCEIGCVSISIVAQLQYKCLQRLFKTQKSSRKRQNFGISRTRVGKNKKNMN